jgi:hypothetical protein
MADKKITQLDELADTSFGDLLVIVDSPLVEAQTKKITLKNLFKAYMNTVVDTYTVLDYDDVVVCNKTTAMTLNLPAATGSGRKLTLKNIGAGRVTVDPNAVELIEGETTQTLIEGECIMIIDYDTGKWLIV